MPSGPTPLGLNEEEEHEIAADSHNNLAMYGGDSHNAPTHPFISTPPSGDTHGASRPTQPLLVRVALDVQSPDPTTVNLVILADRKV
jgi:hypothetical protein